VTTSARVSEEAEVTDDREQERADERDNAARPVTAAARRARRASARDATGRTTAATTGATGKPAKSAKPARPAKASGATRVRRAADATEDTTDAADGAESASWDLSDRDTKGRPTPARDRRQKRPSPVSRSVRFLREVVSELRKVIWPTRRQQVTYTLVVLIFVAVIVAVVFGLDTLFAKGVFWVFG
jgi:preprotein translocase subunit SecE